MRTKTIDFATEKNKEEPWYDLDYDKELIMQSVAKQYHILPSQQDDLQYCDWIRLVSGLMEDTPLGQIVLIRKETDKDIIKRYGPHERRIRAEWTDFRSKHPIYTEEEKMDVAKYFEKMFTEMFL